MTVSLILTPLPSPWSTHVVENDHLVRPAARVVAHGEENTMTRNRGDDLFEEEPEQSRADGREVKVVHLEQEVELERLAPAHQFSASEDYNVV